MNDSFIGIGFAIAVIVIIVAIIFFSYLNEKKRSEALQTEATNQGFTYKKKVSMDEVYGNFELYKKGHSKNTSNLMTKKESGHFLKFFDYRYIIGHGKGRRIYSQTVAIVETDKVLTHFTLEQKGFFHNIGKLFGKKSIDFSESPSFNRKYVLRGENEQLIKQLFKPEIISFFENDPQKWIIETDSTKIMIYRLSKRIKAFDLATYKGEINRIVSLFY